MNRVKPGIRVGNLLSDEILQQQALSRFLFSPYDYTPSNKNLPRALAILGFHHFVTIPKAYSGLKKFNT